MSKTWRRNSDYSSPSRFKRKESSFRYGYEEDTSPNNYKKEKRFNKKNQNLNNNYEDREGW